MSLQTIESVTHQQFGLSPGDSVLVPHAHPDDETMFTGQTISDLAAARVTVIAASATNGENGGNPARRLEEIEAAYDLHGVSTNRLLLGLPDSELHKRKHILTMAKRFGDIATRHGVSAIVTPGWESDGHSDHQAVHLAAMLAATVHNESGIAIFAADAKGEISVPVDRQRKLGGMALFQSQRIGREPELAELIYPDLLENERFTRLDPWQHLGRTIIEIDRIQRYIPQVIM